MPDLVLPVQCNHVELLRVLTAPELRDACDTDVHVRLPERCFAYPSGIALLSGWGLLRRLHGCQFTFDGGEDPLNYLTRMDLLETLGVVDQPQIERFPAAGRFVAITQVDDRDASLQRAVTQVCDMVRHNHSDPETFLEALGWAVAEILDNVGNHAESPVPAILCAQFYPKLRRIEVAVTDMGRGIRASLAPRYAGLDRHASALLSAVRAGVTRDLAIGQGNGLAGCVEIVLAGGGDLHLWSGDAELTFADGAGRRPREVPALPGTGVVLRLDVDQPVDLRRTTIAAGPSTSLFDLSRHRTQDEPRLSVRERCPHTMGRGPARALREAVRADWQTADGKLEPTPITLDFADVELATSSFLDELVGRLAAELGEDRYRDLLSLVGLSDLQRLMTDKVVRQRLDTGHPGAPRIDRAPRSVGELAAVDQRWSTLPRTAVREVYAPAAVLRLDDPELPADSWTERFRDAATSLQILPIEPGWRTRLHALLDELPRPLLIAAPFHSIDHDRAPRCDVHRHHPLHEEVTRALLPHLAGLAGVSIAMPAESLTWLRSEPLRHAMWTCDAVRNVTVFLEDGLLAGDLPLGIGLALLELGMPRAHEPAHSVGMFTAEEIVARQIDPTELARVRGPFGERHSPWGEDAAWGHRAVWRDPAAPLGRPALRPDLARARHQLEDLGPCVPLADLLAEWRVGFSRPGSAPGTRGDRSVLGQPEMSAGIAGLRPDQLHRSTTDVDTGPPLGRGAILISPRLDASPATLLVAAVPDRYTDAVAAEGIVVAHLQDPDQRAFVVDYLGSPFAADWLRAHCATLPAELDGALLQRLPVPAPGHALAHLDQQLRATEDRLDELRDRFVRVRAELFTLPGLGERLRHLRHAAAGAGQVAQLIATVDDFGAQVRSTFPLPLATGWRARETESDPREHFRRTLELTERSLVYLAILLLADLRDTAAGLPKVRELLGALRRPGRGPSLGAWAELLPQAPRLAEDRLLAESPFPELRLLIAKPPSAPFFQAASRLIAQRNDLAHHRGPDSEFDLTEASNRADADFTTLFTELGFLSRYPLRLIERVDFDPLEDCYTAAHRDLIGDHPLVPLRRSTIDRHLGPGLHAVDQWGQPRLLDPWLIEAECPTCHQREVFAPEYQAPSASGNDHLHYKSLTTGHMLPGGAEAWPRVRKFVGAEPDV